MAARRALRAALGEEAEGLEGLLDVDRGEEEEAVPFSFFFFLAFLDGVDGVSPLAAVAKEPSAWD